MSQNEELHRLRKENRALKKKLHELKKASKDENETPESDADCYAKSSYASYLLARLRKTGFYAPAKKVARYVRGSLWLTRLFRIGVLVYQYLQAGAWFILSAAVFLLIVPILLVSSLGTLGFAVLLRPRRTRELLPNVQKETVFLFCTDKEQFSAERFSEEAALFPNATVMIVSPFFLGTKGIGKNSDSFLTYRKERENVYILRKYFFFYFRKILQAKGGFLIHEIHLESQKSDT